MTAEQQTLYMIGFCGAVIVGLWLWVVIQVNRRKPPE